MTVYNGERYLAQAVESVLAQTFTAFEFIIRDDGSTDGSVALLQTYAARDPRLVLHLGQPNLGIVRSMNTLFQQARGQYINRHDADDVSLPERLAQQVAFLDDHPQVGVLGTGVQVIDGEGRSLGVDFFAAATTHAALRSELLEHNSNLCQGSVLFRRACLEQVGLYDESLEQAEDYDLWLRLAEITQLARLDEVLYQYRQHAAGVTKHRYYRALLDKATVFERTLGRRRGQPLTAAERHEIACRYLEAVLAAVAAGEAQPAVAALARAQTQAPDLFVTPAAHLAPRLARWLDAQTAQRSAPDSLALVTELFDTLPPTPALARLRARALAQVHLREVFAGARLGEGERIRRHLWTGLRHDPRWLLNRGVLAILLRSLTGRPHKRRAA